MCYVDNGDFVSFFCLFLTIWDSWKGRKCEGRQFAGWDKSGVYLALGSKALVDSVLMEDLKI
jgi:hypothetical protein